MKHTLKRLLYLSLVLCLLLSAVPAFASSLNTYPFTTYGENGDGTAYLHSYTDHPYYDTYIEDTYMGMPVTTIGTKSIRLVSDPDNDDFFFQRAVVDVPNSITTLRSQIIADGTLNATLYFSADAPSFEEDTFLNKYVTIYYPAGNKTWAAVAGHFFGAKHVTWTPFCGTHTYVDGVCIHCGDGCSHNYVDSPITQEYTCTVCGYVCEHNFHNAGDGTYVCITCKLSCSHDGQHIVTREEGSQCGQPGLIIRTCATCGRTEHEYYTALHHAFGSGNVCQYCGIPKNTTFSYVVLEDDSCKILYSELLGTTVTIPDDVDGYPVSCIGSESFIWKDHQHVTMPASLREIQGSAFGNSALKTLVLTGDAPSISAFAFSGCGTVTIEYPAGNETYTQEVFDSVPNTIWVPYCLEHSYVEGVCRYCGEADPNPVSGDLDGDHAVTVGDVAMIYAHVKGTTLLEGYALQQADLNGDNQVDIADTAMAYKQIKS